MIVRAGSGWQTVLADLSMILFMVTGAALSQAEAEAEANADKAGSNPLSPEGAAMALYRAGPGAPSLTEWIETQGTGSSQQLTIVSQYAAGGLEAALGTARVLAGEAGAAGARSRIVVEPGAGGASATLAYDAPEASQLPAKDPKP